MTERIEQRMAISGASGLIGSTLSKLARDKGWTVVPMVRSRDADGIYWSARENVIDVEALEGFDAVVHLAGENIAGGMWTKSRKESILKSRTRGTSLVAGAMTSLNDPPKVFVCASGASYYGDHGDQWVDEDTEQGEGFLAEVIKAWEESCEPAREAGCRVVNTRFGPVIAKDSGMLAKMLLPFKLGLGGRVGDGEQYISWIAVCDVARAILFAIEHHELNGPVNVVSPNPTKNKEFTETLGDVLGRPTILPTPVSVLKLRYGAQMINETLLSGQRVQPKKLAEAGFTYMAGTLREALEMELG